LVVGAVAIVAIGACGPTAHQPSWMDSDEDAPEFSAAALGDPVDEEGDILLTPAERDALARAQDSRANVGDGTPVGQAEQSDTTHEGWGDRVGKFGLALVMVGMTVGAAVAPFFAL
jgi:hypothetical protein